MILTKTVTVRAGGKNINRYRELGYDVKFRQPIEVKVEDLPNRSSVRIVCRCDEEGCGNTREISYSAYRLTFEKLGHYRCFQCGQKAKEQIFLDKYGVANPMMLKEIAEKVQKTSLERYGYRFIFEADNFQDIKKMACLEKYGVEHQLQSDLIKEKIKATNLQKYGVENPTSSPEIQKKIKKTNLEKYGYEYTSQSPQVKAKVAKTNAIRYGGASPTCDKSVYEKQQSTNLKRYGAKNPFGSPAIQKKIKETLFADGKQQVSTQQRHIHDLYGGTLNYPIGKYSADILTPDNIIVEYDGGGHDLQVKFKHISEKEFLQKEIIRNSFVKKQGYKQIRIVSRKDMLPSDGILKQMISDARAYFFDYPEHSWITFDIDQSIVRNAENKSGAYYDYGEIKLLSKGRQHTERI